MTSSTAASGMIETSSVLYKFFLDSFLKLVSGHSCDGDFDSVKDFLIVNEDFHLLEGSLGVLCRKVNNELEKLKKK